MLQISFVHQMRVKKYTCKWIQVKFQCKHKRFQKMIFLIKIRFQRIIADYCSTNIPVKLLGVGEQFLWFSQMMCHHCLRYYALQPNHNLNCVTIFEDVISRFILCSAWQPDVLLVCTLSDINLVNSLRPSDVIWCYRSGSTLAQVMACCLMSPSHYLN